MIVNYYKRYTILKEIRNSCISLILLFVSLSNVYGQQTRMDPPPLKERLFYGGSFGLQFGTITDIEFSPIIGIWVLPRLAAAAGPNFRYFKDPWDRTTIYGGKTYVELVFLEDLDNIIPLGVHLGMYLHAEDEALSLESSFFKTTPNDSKRFMINTLLAGAGIRQQVSQRSSLNLTFLWALNNAGYGIYGNPEVRVSFIF
jgi:hypothetical protein